MKLRLLIVAAIVVFVSSCTYRTCPTYSKAAKPDKTEIKG